MTLFGEDSYWRDLVAFTWNIRTQEGPVAIRKMLQARLADVKPSNFQVEGQATAADGVIDAWFTFETALARGRGQLRLKAGKAWTLLTTMTELKGFEEKKGANRIKGAEHGVHPGRKTWTELREDEAKTLGFTEQPYVVIVGGGQGGIALGARLRRLGVPTIIIEKNARPGDSWRKRYKNLCLHDPVWYDHLPYLPFPDDWPVFAPKDKIGDWLARLAGTAGTHGLGCSRSSHPQGCVSSRLRRSCGLVNQRLENTGVKTGAFAARGSAWVGIG